MSNYYYNEKEGRYESIEDAPLLKRDKLRRKQKEVFCAETFDERPKDVTRAHYETRHATSPVWSKERAKEKNKKGCGLVIVIAAVAVFAAISAGIISCFNDISVG